MAIAAGTSTHLEPAQEAPEQAERGKADRRRDELADSALITLGQLGYARTSLREIAANSEFSHGVVHYYFRDKTELITYCVRRYKTTCSKRYDSVVESAGTAAELAEGFVARMTGTLREETAMHRLWYDLRGQSMFEPGLREDVRAIDDLLEAMTWRVLARYAELSGTAVLVDPPTAYGLLDGLFEQAVVAASDDVESAAGRLAERVTAVLPRVLG